MVQSFLSLRDTTQPQSLCLSYSTFIYILPEIPLCKTHVDDEHEHRLCSDVCGSKCAQCVDLLVVSKGGPPPQAKQLSCGSPLRWGFYTIYRHAFATTKPTRQSCEYDGTLAPDRPFTRAQRRDQPHEEMRATVHLAQMNIWKRSNWPWPVGMISYCIGQIP